MLRFSDNINALCPLCLRTETQTAFELSCVRILAPAREDKWAMSLGGRLALVTGGSSGIGEAVCRVLAAQDAIVVVAAGRVESAQRVAQSLQGEAAHCALHVDVGDASSVQELFENIHSMFPQTLSIVVNCAGVAQLSHITDSADDFFDEIIGIN